MGSFDEFSLSTRVFLKTYRWRRIEPTPWTPLEKPLRKCRVALVTTAGFIEPGQPRYDRSIRSGDTSWRMIADDVDLDTLIEDHRSEAFDHAGVAADPNLAFPRDRLHELVARGRIGSVNHRHLSFMGSITAVGPLVKRSAPDAASEFLADKVDVVLLVPV